MFNLNSTEKLSDWHIWEQKIFQFDTSYNLGVSGHFNHLCYLHRRPQAFASPAMGHWGTCPSSTSDHFRPTKLWYSTVCGYLPRKKYTGR